MSPKWLSDIMNPPSSIPPKAKVELNSQESQYSLGEQVKGFVRITSDEEFEANQAFVRLYCHENIKKSRIIGINMEHSKPNIGTPQLSMILLAVCLELHVCLRIFLRHTNMR